MLRWQLKLNYLSVKVFRVKQILNSNRQSQKTIPLHHHLPKPYGYVWG